jgi:membrane-associated phospholipid phosphatase
MVARALAPLCAAVLASTLVAERAEAAEPDAVTEHRMTWTYPRFRPVEYAVSALSLGAALYLERGTRGFPENRMVGGILLDEATRDVFVAGTEESRDTAAHISDVMWPVTQWFPLVDSLITPLATDRFNVDVAVQMTLINWQVQAVAFLLTRATHRIVGRSRPLVSGCEEDPAWDYRCSDPKQDEGLRASFLSGHASMAFAGAGLTCSHHIALPMYGGNAADAAICGLSLASATTVGVLRIVADKHWWSDVVAGVAVGTATGFGLPFLLHYAPGVSGGFLAKRVVLLPLASDTVAGVAVAAVD